MSAKVYEIITDRIIGMLAQGTVPWRKSWSSDLPRSLVSDREYRGVNVFLLECAGFGSPYWITYKQAQERRGFVKEGQRGMPVVFWKWLEKDNPKTGKVERIPFLRYFTVFNAAEQCTGLKIPAVDKRGADFRPIEECERLVKTYENGPTIKLGSQQAFYRPSRDEVHVPSPERFTGAEQFYATLFHELGHSTGHGNRLARKGITDAALFGSHTYSKEELVAEMTSAFLSGVCGLENTIESSAAYIKGWLRVLRDDPKMVVQAAAAAQKAADLIRGIKHEQPAEDEAPEAVSVAA
jgi:antirestriction protein ArdC